MGMKCVLLLCCLGCVARAAEMPPQEVPMPEAPAVDLAPITVEEAERPERPKSEAEYAWEAECAKNPKAREIEAWIKQLNAEKFDDRDRAKVRLFEIGMPTLPGLDAAMAKDAPEDLETFDAAKRLVFKIKRQRLRDKYLKADGLAEIGDGIKVKLLEIGDGPELQPGAMMALHFRGLLLNGHEFEAEGKERTLYLDTWLPRMEGKLAKSLCAGSKWLVVMPNEVAGRYRLNAPEGYSEPMLVFEMTVPKQNPVGASSSTSSTGCSGSAGSEIP